MAGNIKGITIEFAGDTTKLDQSIRNIDKNTRGLDSELKKVNNALKFNPTSVELWSQKQTILKQKIQDTESRLKLLKQQQASMDAKGVDKNSAEYRNLQREIITTESKLKTFKGQLQAVGNVKLRVASEQLKQIGSKATAAGNAMRGLSRAAGVVAGAIGALAYKSGQLADDLNTLQKKYHLTTRQLQLFAAAAKLVDVDVETIAKSHTKLTKSMSKAQQGSKTQSEAFKKLGISITDSNGELRDGDEVWQEAIAALGEMKNETERDALAMDLFGKSAADLNPLIEDGGEAYKNLSDTMDKYGLDFIDQDTLDKANEFNDKIDTIKAVGALAFQTLGSKIAGVLAPALDKVVEAVGNFAKWFTGLDPVIIAVTGGIALLVAAIAPALLIFGALASAAGTLMGVLAGISAPMIAVGAAIAALVAAFVIGLAKSEPFRNAMLGLVKALGAALLPVVKTVITFVKQFIKVLMDTVTSIADSLAPVIVALTPILTKVATILSGVLKKGFTVLIAIIKVAASVIKTLVSIFSTVFLKVVSIVTGAVSKIKNAFSAVKEALTGPFEKAKSAIKGIVDAIKRFFNFSVPTPHVPLPHFAIKPSGWKISDLLDGKIPSLSVKWYAKGGIFNSPTLAGIGEAGPEAVVPLDKFWKKLEDMSTGNIVVNVYGSDNMSVNELAEAVEQKLIQMQNRRRLAWQ